MKSIDKLQRVFDYIESCLTTEVDINNIAQIMCENKESSERIFRFLTGVTIKEYYKNRKLSMAGIELLKEDSKVLDVAVKFGYSSSQAFTRAFRAYHGFNPMEIKKSERELKLFAPFVFTIELGTESMNYKIVDLQQRQLYGIYLEIQDEKYVGAFARQFWKNFDKSQVKGNLYGFYLNDKNSGKYYIASDIQFVNSSPIKIEKSKFAVFSFDRTSRTEEENIDNILKYWIEQSGVVFNDKVPIIEKYLKDTLEIYYPIKFLR